MPLQLSLSAPSLSIKLVTLLLCSKLTFSAPFVELSDEARTRRALVDEDVNPCDDFYLYACKKWTSQNPIPPGHKKWSPLDSVAKSNKEWVASYLREHREMFINNQTEITEPHLAAEQQVYKQLDTFFQSCLKSQDPANFKWEDVKKITDHFVSLDYASQKGRFTAFALAQLNGIHPFFKLTVEDSTRQVYQLTVTHGSFGLPFPEDFNIPAKKDAYQKVLEKIFESIPHYLDDHADKKNPAADIVELESKLAAFVGQLKRPYSKAVTPMYDFQTELPYTVPWEKLFRKVGIQKLIQIVEHKPVGYLSYMDGLLSKVSPETLKHTFVAHALLKLVSQKVIRDQQLNNQFQSFEKTVYGIEQPLPLTSHCTMLADKAFSPVLSRYVSNRHASRETHHAVHDLMKHLKQSYSSSLSATEWIPEPHKSTAQAKIASMSVDNIGLPAKFTESSQMLTLAESFESLTLTDSFFTNTVRLWKREQELLFSKVDTSSKLDAPTGTTNLVAQYVSAFSES
jgi:endothelin-converting enzyme/putative endopeptidase